MEKRSQRRKASSLSWRRQHAPCIIWLAMCLWVRSLSAAIFSKLSPPAKRRKSCFSRRNDFMFHSCTSQWIVGGDAFLQAAARAHEVEGMLNELLGKAEGQVGDDGGGAAPETFVDGEEVVAVTQICADHLVAHPAQGIGHGALALGGLPDHAADARKVGG